MFLLHAADDQTVPVENSLLLAQAMMAAHRPVELHIVPQLGAVSKAWESPRASAWMLGRVNISAMRAAWGGLSSSHPQQAHRSPSSSFHTTPVPGFHVRSRATLR